MAASENFSESLRQVRVKRRSQTRSIGDVIADFKNKRIIIPEYQRKFVWELDKQCRFIESVFMDMPIPPLFLLEKFSPEKGTHIFELIDGVQRLTTLENFYDGVLELSNLQTLSGLNKRVFDPKSKPINGLIPVDPEAKIKARKQVLPLDDIMSSIFWSREISVIIIESDTHPEIQFEVFGRLNQGSVSLNAQELRNCMFHGSFNSFLVDKCSQKSQYKELLSPFRKFQTPKDGRPDKNRGLDVELILRFFAVYELHKDGTGKYPDTRGEVLNEYMRKRIEHEKDASAYPSFRTNQELEILLEKVTRMVALSFNGNHFKSFSAKKDKADFSASINQSVFDVQMLGFTEYEEKDIEGITDVIYDSFLELSSFNDPFIDAITRSTNHKVKTRVEIWSDRLKEIIENPEPFKKRLSQKKASFANNPVCSVSGIKLTSFEEADHYTGKLYHKHYSPRKDSKVRKTPDIPVTFYLEGSENISDNMYLLVDLVMDSISDRIQDNEIEIQRLALLEFIGSSEELRTQSTRSMKRLRKINLSLHNKQLYIDAGGNRDEISQMLQEICSLFSFTSDFEIID